METIRKRMREREREKERERERERERKRTTVREKRQIDSERQRHREKVRGIERIAKRRSRSLFQRPMQISIVWSRGTQALCCRVRFFKMSRAQSLRQRTSS